MPIQHRHVGKFLVNPAAQLLDGGASATLFTTRFERSEVNLAQVDQRSFTMYGSWAQKVAGWEAEIDARTT